MSSTGGSRSRLVRKFERPFRIITRRVETTTRESGKEQAMASAKEITELSERITKCPDCNSGLISKSTNAREDYVRVRCQDCGIEKKIFTGSGY
jgi:predicted RNA-binding Zn-ribbon protein involved in translation (DUF1610 family)